MLVKNIRNQHNAFVSREMVCESANESTIILCSLIHYVDHLSKQISGLSLYGYSREDLRIMRELRDEKLQVEAMIKVLMEAD